MRDLAPHHRVHGVAERHAHGLHLLGYGSSGLEGMELSAAGKRLASKDLAR
jgi:hypothetical protein